MAASPEKSAVECKKEVDASREPTEQYEVFKVAPGGVDFRTVTWQRATLIFLKCQVATGVLGIPGALYSLGAVGGGLSIIGWQIINTYTAIIMGNFRNNHPQCHTLVDMMGVLWGPIGREFVGFMFLVAFILCAGSGILGTSIAFNALSEHGACSVLFSFVSTVLVVMFSSIRTWDRMTWPLTLAFVSVMAGILTVTVGVTLNDRPAAAPRDGPFDLGFRAVAYPTFAAGITASATIFISSAAGPSYVPIIAEMRKPRDFKKPVLIVAFIVMAIYLSISMVIYRWCGQWVATPALGSAGPLLKKVAYGIALPSLIVSAGIFNHAASKYLFVRLLRNSPHLQSNSPVHWGTWLGCNILLGFLSFILASAIPVFNFILSLAGSICFGPMSLIFPALMWMHDHPGYKSGGAKEKVIYGLHWFIALVGMFLVVGGTYGTAESIKAAYASGTIGKAFDCADNSNTVA
ncbi:transmembrane amino acid transporter protein-domain-containing protein [Xylariaceae sp. FL0804]|nr:transmembrane amino acid transporter protein-domain-containing protein [Xylariaceae sp. FL0804]